MFAATNLHSDFNNYCLDVFSKIRPSCTFLSINEYINNYSETSNFGICFHVNYLKTVERSYKILEKMSDLCDCSGQQFSPRDLNEAKKELMNSFEITLLGMGNPNYTCEDVYENVYNSDGELIRGLKLHTKEDAVHIEGTCVRKDIIIPGKYPIRKSASKTLAKNFLRNKTPLGKWVQFKLIPFRFKTLTVEKMILIGDSV